MVRQPREPKKPKKPKKRRPGGVNEHGKPWNKPDGARRVLRWLHAGLCKDPNGTTINVWYAFQKRKRKSDGKIIDMIVYAGDNQGGWLGNLDVGQIKRNLITFDEHHRRHWAHFLDENGQWKLKEATKGRQVQWESLRDTFYNHGFRDPFPEGRVGAIGPALNVIHAPEGVLIYEEVAEPRGRCYPDSRIPFSTAHIKADAYKESHRNPLQVIAEFLSGNMSNRDNTRNQEGFHMLQLARAESAFLELGWRIDRRAAISASRDVRDGVVNTLVQSVAWREHPPRRVDKFKGAAVSKMLKDFGGDGGNADEDAEDSDNASDSDDWDGDSDDDDDGDNGNPNPLFVGERRSSQSAKAKGKARSKGKQRSTDPYPTQKSQRCEPLDDDEELDDLEANLVRGLLNENNGPPPGYRRSAPAVGEAGPVDWQMIISDDEDDSDLNDSNPASRQAPKFRGLMSMHMESMSKQGTAPLTPSPKSEDGSMTPPPETTNNTGSTHAPALIARGAASALISPPMTPHANTPSASKRPSPIDIADEPETAAKRIKSENNYIIMKAEDGPELIILDDDDDEAGAGTSDDPYTLDDD